MNSNAPIGLGPVTSNSYCTEGRMYMKDNITIQKPLTTAKRIYSDYNPTVQQYSQLVKVRKPADNMQSL